MFHERLMEGVVYGSVGVAVVHLVGRQGLSKLVSPFACYALERHMHYVHKGEIRP